MDIFASTVAYERWLGAHVPLRRPDLHLKHELMAADVFSFLRATFYRWAAQWPEVCAELDGPKVLAVGDLHVENFGTWRDAEGRLIWGVNDFDEVVTLPYTQELVRIGTSAMLAAQAGQLLISTGRACTALLEGYTEALSEGGGAAVLAERYRWLRDLAIARLKDQRPFWQRMQALPEAAGRANPQVRRLLVAALPAGKVVRSEERRV